MLMRPEGGLQLDNRDSVLEFIPRIFEEGRGGLEYSGRRGESGEEKHEGDPPERVTSRVNTAFRF
jgi:hypothetical protein